MTQREDDERSTQEIVAAEVRAEMARHRISARKAAGRLGWTQPYLSRRMTGAIPFDVADLAALAELLEVPISKFFPMAGGVRRAPISARPGLAVAA